MTVQAQFEAFNKKIYLSHQDSGYKNAAEKDSGKNGILTEIKTQFRQKGYPVIDTFLQGSFAKEVITAIYNKAEDYDIDRAIVISHSTAPADPIAPKQLIRDILLNRSFKAPKIKKPCVTADYQSRKLHIDYTVYTLDDSNQYRLAVGKEGASIHHKEWSISDPHGLISWITSTAEYGQDQLKQRKQFRRLVRYLKRWRDVTFTNEAVRKKIFSIAITVMVKKQYQANLNSDLTALINTISGILQRERYFRQDHNNDSQYRVNVSLPCHSGRDIFNHTINGMSYKGSDLNTGTQFKNQLTSLLKNLKAAAEQTSSAEACKILRDVFGTDFKISQSGGAAVAAGAFPSAGAMGTTQGANQK